MAAVTNQTFANETVSVDGKTFTNCTFTNVILLFEGGDMPTFNDCRFSDVTLDFGGPAANTLEFLGGLYGGGFVQACDNVMQEIRSPRAL